MSYTMKRAEKRQHFYNINDYLYLLIPLNNVLLCSPIFIQNQQQKRVVFFKDKKWIENIVIF